MPGSETVTLGRVPMNRDSLIGGNGGEKAWLEDGLGLVHIALFEAAVA